MIKSLSIKNYQSHHNSKFTFHEGVNVIIGSSDCGKTAIIRALKWVINNSPSGDSFRTYKSKETSIKLELDDEFAIIRIKSNSNNEYKIQTLVDMPRKQDLNVFETFKAFGQGVPEKIQHLLNIRECHIGGTIVKGNRTGGIKYSINFQHQLDSSFLLSNNSGEVARILNNIVNLDIIDQCLSSISKRERNTKQQLEYEKKYLEKTESQIKEYNYLEQMEKDITELEGKEARQLKTEDQISTLYNHISDGEKLSSETARINDFLKIEPYALDLERKAATGDDMARKHTNLSLLIEEIQDLEVKKVEIGEILEAEDEVAKLQSIGNKVNEMEDNSIRIDEFIDSIRTTEAHLSNIDGELKFCQDEFNKLMPNTCPLCNK